MADEFHSEIVWMRVFAAFLVVFLHASSDVFYSFEQGWYIAAFYIALAKPCVPLFLMITGYLLLAKDGKPGEFYKKRFLKILPPFIAYSVFYDILNVLVGKKESLVSTLYAFLSDPTKYNLWYLYVLIPIYLIMPFLRKIFLNSTESEIRWLCIVWAFFAVLLPAVNVFFPLPIEFMGMSNFSAFTSLLLYVFIGAYARRFAVNQHLIKIKVCVSLALAYFATLWISEKKQIADETFFSYASIFILFIRCTFFTCYSGPQKRPPPGLSLPLLSARSAFILSILLFLGCSSEWGSRALLSTR